MTCLKKTKTCSSISSTHLRVNGLTYDGITIAIDAPKWMTCYIKDKEQRLSKPAQKQNKQDKQAAPLAPPVKPAAAIQGAAAPRDHTPFDPMKWKNQCSVSVSIIDSDSGIREMRILGLGMGSCGLLLVGSLSLVRTFYALRFLHFNG